MPRKRKTYHHGDLSAALIKAADELIAVGGVENFSLRAAASRAGVSPSAPAHHFGGAKGLLTEVVLLAYQRASQYLEEVSPSDDPVAEVRALSFAFIKFALDYPGHFRLIFRNDLLNRNDPRFPKFTLNPSNRLAQAIAAYQGKADFDLARFEDAADMFLALAALHGLVHLVLAEKMTSFFEYSGSREFLENELLRVIERMYPRQTETDEG